tara:strand:- start:7898 stop:8764 length:867 start_codon:yes stop_codon:yes gene_type:complete
MINFVRLRIKLRRFIAKYMSSFVRLAFYLKIEMMNFQKKPPVIILTVGKVGSSSVYRTLKLKLSNYNVFHIHYFTEKSIKEAEHRHLNSDRRSIPLHLIISKILLKKINNYNGKIKFICIVREPISRSISSFFQNIDFHKDSIEKIDLSINTNRSLKILKKVLRTSLLTVEQWIETEIRENLKIDIYKKPFEEKNFVTYKNKKFELLLLKMESLESGFKNSSKDFFNLNSSVSLLNHNISERKYYFEDYKKTKEKIKVEKEIIDTITSSTYFKHFYKRESNYIYNKYL